MELEQALDVVQGKLPGAWTRRGRAEGLTVHPGEMLRAYIIQKADESTLSIEELHTVFFYLVDKAAGHVDVDWTDYFGVEFRNSNAIRADELDDFLHTEFDPERPGKIRSRSFPEPPW